MELSPLAREKLAKIGEMSASEKEKLKLSEELTSLLSDYFTDKLNADALWIRLKKFKEDGREFMIKETQLRLISAISLGGSKVDFERCRSGIMGSETLKEQNRYPELEINLKSMENLRQQYQQEKDATFSSMKANIQGQVKMAAQQLARQAGKQRVAVDVEGSAEASVRASPQWRDFILKHEKTYGSRFDDLAAKLKRLL